MSDRSMCVPAADAVMREAVLAGEFVGANDLDDPLTQPKLPCTAKMWVSAASFAFLCADLEVAHPKRTVQAGPRLQSTAEANLLVYWGRRLSHPLSWSHPWSCSAQ